MTENANFRIRAITAFCSLPEQKEQQTLLAAKQFSQTAQTALEKTGLQIQECRVGADCFLDFDQPVDELVTRIKNVDKHLEDYGLILNHGSTSNPTALQKVPALLAATKNIYFQFSLPPEASSALFRQAASSILEVASKAGVDGSFRFCVNSQCPPHIPYFPSSYSLSDTKPSFALGFESSGILDTIEDFTGDLLKLELDLKTRLTAILSPVEAVCLEIEKTTGFQYLHLDTSICPKEETPRMTALWEKFSISSFGQSGTLSLCSAITNAVKSVDVRRGGFCGLMLPVCEDLGLAEAANEKSIRISDLLYYSTVCACGLDCVPVSGYGDDPRQNQETESKIAALLMDMHSIAVKLKKPLSCRLLPVNGKKTGEFTNFNFPFLFEAKIMEL